MAMEHGGGGGGKKKTNPFRSEMDRYVGLQQSRAKTGAIQGAMTTLSRLGPGGMGGYPFGGGGGGGGGGRYGGGGGGGGAAAARAAEEARRAKQRALVEQLYKQQLGRLNTGRNEAKGVLPGYLKNARTQLQRVNHQNVQAGRTARSQIGRDQGVAASALQQALMGLRGDLMGQGSDVGALMGAGQMFQADTRAAAAAGQGFNSRLDAIMRMAYGDQLSGAAQINQAALGSLSTNYQQALGQLQQERTAALMGLV